MGLLWERSPWETRLAPFFAVLGWFVAVGGSTKRSTNGVVTDCSGFDFGPLLFGVITLILTGAGFVKARRQHEQRRPPEPVFTVISAVLVVAGIALVLKTVLDPAGSFC